jgi:hypothetical protein
MKKIVSLVDRVAFDDAVYPAATESTTFKSAITPYHNFTQESITAPFVGEPEWGRRTTFSMPWPWKGDFLNWIALRLKPSTWMTLDAYAHIGADRQDWVPVDPATFWIWSNQLACAAIERVELELGGVIIEEFSGDWINVWNRTMHTASRGAPYDDALFGHYATQTVQNIQVSDDGFFYVYLPFWFSKHANTALPLCAIRGPDTVRVHVTFRQFKQVVRMLSAPATCDASPLGAAYTIRDYTYPFKKLTTLTNLATTPGFEVGDVVCGISHIDGPLREAYVTHPNELLMESVVETDFYEPLKYVAITGESDCVKVQLPLSAANGPLRQILFFLRRKAAVEAYRDWTNYSATLEAEADPVWNPVRPLLVRAQLQVGTAVWADEEERWWRAAGDVLLPGGVRAYGSYIYAYNFAETPHTFDPSGSLNASRADLRLNLTVRPPGGAADGEWSVHVFMVGTNWMRFDKGLVNPVFMD